MDEKRQQALVRYQAGEEIGKIAEALVLSNGTVWNWINKAGVLRQKKRSIFQDDAVRDYLSGDSYATVAGRYGISMTTMQDWVRRAGATGRGGRAARSAESREEAVTLYLAGRRYTEIATVLKVTADTVARWVEQAGVVEKGGAAARDSLDKESTLQMYAQGGTIEAISSSLGRSVNTVSTWLHEENVQVLSSAERMSIEDRSTYSAMGVQARKEKMLPRESRICDTCKSPFELPYGRRKSRQKYCSIACSSVGRSNPNKKITLVCEHCKVEFVTWANQRQRKYCSQAHYLKANKTIPEYGYKGRVLQSGYEAAFVGLCSIFGVPFEFFDRAENVVWDGQQYGPDFVVQVAGKPVYVDTKGIMKGRYKWQAFRDAGRRLAIVGREDLNRLRQMENASEFLAALRDLAVEQGVS